MNIGVNKYKATDNPILKVKYKQEFYRDAEEFNKEHMLGTNDLKKKKKPLILFYFYLMLILLLVYLMLNNKLII
jgi:hypothetical protein